MAVTQGWQGKFYRTAAALADLLDATINAATWLEVQDVEVVTPQNTGRTEIDVSTRRDGEVANIDLGRFRSGFSITYKLDPAVADSVTDFEALETAHSDRTVIGIAAMDGAIGTTGSRGLVGNFRVSDVSRAEPLDGAMVHTIVFVPAGRQRRFKK